MSANRTNRSVQSNNGRARSSSRGPRKNTAQSQVIKNIQNISPYFVVIILAIIIYKITQKSISYAEAMFSFLSVFLACDVLLQIILRIKNKKSYFCLFFMVILLFNAAYTKARFEDDETARAISPSSEASTVSSATSNANVAATSFTKWTENIYLQDFNTVLEEDIMELLLADAYKYTNGSAVRPIRISDSDLNSGSYGTYIAEAKRSKIDRKKCETPSIIAYAITYERKQRELAYSEAKEANNAKEIGSLYALSADPMLFPETSKYECLLNALKYFIEALELSYADDYEYSYQQEIWKSIRDTYLQLSTLTTLDEASRQKASLISISITHYFNFES